MASTAKAPAAFPWLGIVGIVAAAIVALFLVNRVVPAADTCSSDLLTQTRGLDFNLKTKAVDAGANVSPAAQTALTEKLQEYVQASSTLCRMNKSGVLPNAEYATQIAQINSQIGILKKAADAGLLGSSQVTRTDIEKILYASLNARVHDGPFIVFFDWSKNQVSPEAGTILDNVASACKAAREAGGKPILDVRGFDSQGEEDSGPPLPAERLISVVDYVRQHGCDVPATIAVNPPTALVPTADGIREPANRRVEIGFSAGLY
jgi:hypothetical protein